MLSLCLREPNAQSLAQCVEANLNQKQPRSKQESL
jgi:hypothetical protein